VRAIALAVLLAGGSILGCGSRSELLLGGDSELTRRDAGEGADTSTDAPVADVRVDAHRDSSPPTDAEPDVGPECVKPLAYILTREGEISRFDPGTFQLTPLGTPTCNATGNAYTFTVTREGSAFILYEDWSIYLVGLSDMSCTKTSFDGASFGLTGFEGVAVSRSAEAEKLYIYGPNASGGGELVVADVDTLQFESVGSVEPNPSAYPIDMQTTPAGLIYGMTDTGMFVEIAESDASVVERLQAPFEASAAWALMTYGAGTYLFGTVGAVTTFYDYDVSANTTTALTTMVGQGIVGASAVPCP
jgi:hypothetical protein